MYPFPKHPLLENRSQYKLDAAPLCPFFIAARIRVNYVRNKCISRRLIILYRRNKQNKLTQFVNNLLD